MWENIKLQALELIQRVEDDLVGAPGSEKRKTVVNTLCATIDIPLIPEFVENMFEPIVYGWIIDGLTGLLNSVTRKNFRGVVLTPEQQLKVVALVNVKPDGENIIEKEPVDADGDIDARLNALYERYITAK